MIFKVSNPAPPLPPSLPPKKNFEVEKLKPICVVQKEYKPMRLKVSNPEPPKKKKLNLKGCNPFVV
jgi:hypothetical protein